MQADWEGLKGHCHAMVLQTGPWGSGEFQDGGQQGKVLNPAADGCEIRNIFARPCSPVNTSQHGVPCFQSDAGYRFPIHRSLRLQSPKSVVPLGIFQRGGPRVQLEVHSGSGTLVASLLWAVQRQSLNPGALSYARGPLFHPEAGLSMEDPTPPLDTPEVVGGLKTRLVEGAKSIGRLWKSGLACTPCCKAQYVDDSLGLLATCQAPCPFRDSLPSILRFRVTRQHCGVIRKLLVVGFSIGVPF